MEEEKRTEHELAVEAKAFLDALLDDAKRRALDPELVLSLFGFFAKSVVDMRVQNGEAHHAAMIEVVDHFMQGLGMKTVVCGDEDKPRDLH